MTTTLDIIETIDGIIEEKSLLKHPFYQAWNAGTLSVETLREYARQYFHFEAAFPRFLSSIHANCDSAEARHAILNNLWDEEHGDDNHLALWLRFCEGLGLSEAEVRSSVPNAETRELVDGFRAACAGDAVTGIATIYSYESQAPEVARQKIAGLQAFYGMEEPRTISFFAVHAGLDVEHSEAERQILRAAQSDAERTSIEAAVRDATDRLWRFLDGAYANP